MRIGIYGGSFNPVHRGHIQVALAARDEFHLDRVLFMVAKDPPHKTIAGHVEASARFEMTRRALEDETGLEACTLEMERAGKSYTIETVRQVKELYDRSQIFCIVGADMLMDLPNWYKARQLMRETGFIATGRMGVREDLSAVAANLKSEYGAKVFLSSFVGPEISSTAVRKAVFEAEPVEKWIKESTAAYIYENGLYLPEEFVALQHKLRENMDASRYVHTMGTVRCAIDLAARYGVDGKQARLAALLHDCAKFAPQQLLASCEEYGLDVEELKKDFISVIHGPLGAMVARREYGVEDEAVLSAVYWHTLCHEDMTVLEKIIYLADKIETGRKYAGIEAIREATDKSLDAGVLACMERSIAYVQTRGKKLHPNVIGAREYLLEHGDFNK